METRISAPQVCSRWLGEHVASIRSTAATTIPTVSPGQTPLLPGLDLWDLWPLQLPDGNTARFGGWSVWFVLSAPVLPDPESRHAVARIRMLTEREGQWRDCGNALPDGLNPGSREWAGSALHHPETGALTLFFTAAGHLAEPTPSFAQRLFQTTGQLTITDGNARVSGWSAPRESFAANERYYQRVTQTCGTPGFIKGFRDPAHFRDPASGETYLLFTASLAGSNNAFNGCIGIARACDPGLDRWDQLPPLVSADGLANEQERPVMIHHSGRYYLFWSTQRHVFAPNGPSGPNGLYGMAADRLSGPWLPLNGTGLVAANPASAPYQCYSWWVEADLTASAFLDYPGVAEGHKQDSPAWRRAHFGGTPAPRFQIRLEGDSASITDA